MAQGYEYGSGYQYGIPLPASEYGNRPAAEYVRGLSFSQSGSTVTITVTDQDDKATPYTFETGSDDAITGISITNENGVYTVKATTAGGTETEIGTIEVPTVNVDNLLAEINDEVVEDNTNGYDFHTLKETENNGTVNEVGKFYLAQKQIANWNDTPQTFLRLAPLKVVNQSGELSDTKYGLIGQPSKRSFVTLASYTGAIPDGTIGMVINTEYNILDTGTQLVFVPLPKETIVALAGEKTINSVKGNTWTSTGASGTGGPRDGIRIIAHLLGGRTGAFSYDNEVDHPLAGYIILSIEANDDGTYTISGAGSFCGGSHSGDTPLDWGFV